MRLIPLAGDEFLPKRQRGGDVIEGNKLISRLQDNVQSRVLDPRSVITGAGQEEKRAERSELAGRFISLGGNPYFIGQFTAENPRFFPPEVF